MVKSTFGGWAGDDAERDVPAKLPVAPAKPHALARVLTRKPMRPTAAEIEANPRAESARLRPSSVCPNDPAAPSAFVPDIVAESDHERAAVPARLPKPDAKKYLDIGVRRASGISSRDGARAHAHDAPDVARRRLKARLLVGSRRSSPSRRCSCWCRSTSSRAVGVHAGTALEGTGERATSVPTPAQHGRPDRSSAPTVIKAAKGLGMVNGPTAIPIAVPRLVLPPTGSERRRRNARHQLPKGEARTRSEPVTFRTMHPPRDRPSTARRRTAAIRRNVRSVRPPGPVPCARPARRALRSPRIPPAASACAARC